MKTLQRKDFSLLSKQKHIELFDNKYCSTFLIMYFANRESSLLKVASFLHMLGDKIAT